MRTKYFYNYKNEENTIINIKNIETKSCLRYYL
jgi:hypothetical protein